VSWKDAYSAPGTAFGVKGPFYDPNVGHRGRDYYIRHDVIPSYVHGVVSHVGRTGGLGGVIGITDDEGFGRGWAHVADIAVSVGDEVWPGTTLGRPATWDDPISVRGSLWAGSHIHTTKARTAFNAAVGNTPLYDPTGDIAAAVAASATASSGRKTISEPEKEEEDDMKLEVFGHDAGDGTGNLVYWLVNHSAATKWRIRNGDQLDYYKARGFEFFAPQPPQILEGYREI
jgi:hypothetical protein